MRARLLPPVLVAVLVLAALGLSACGGGGGSGDEGQISDTIKTVATTSDPKNCTELETLRFTEQNTSAKGKQSTEACEKEAEAGEEVAEGVKVSNVSVDGDKATADADLEGGPLGSQGLKLGMVEEDGGWKIDQIEGFSSYDGKALAKAFEESFEEESEGLSNETAKCIADQIAEATQAEAEELFLGGSPKALIELSQGCA